MIERYSRAVMRNIWTEENKFNAYLEVEILAAEAWSALGVVPAEDVSLLWLRLKSAVIVLSSFSPYFFLQRLYSIL